MASTGGGGSGSGSGSGSASASASGFAHSTHAHGWTGATTADTDLQAHRLSFVASALDTAIDRQRAPGAVDWAVDRGVHGGHVLVLYKLARNGLKWSAVGRVPSTEDMAFALFLGLALLLRVAQDVQACVTDLGRPCRAWVFDAFCTKVAGWVAGWHPDSLPELTPVTARVLAWAARPGHGWPSPAWAASFVVPSFVGSAFTFAEPTAVDVAAFDRCRTLDGTRAEVAARMRSVLEGVTVWDGALARRLRSLVVTDAAPAGASASASASASAGAPASVPTSAPT